MSQKRAVVMVVVWQESRKVLLVKKGEEPWSELSKQWVLPAETLELGETDLAAVHRGLREEANLEVGEPFYLTESMSYGGTEIGWYSCVAQSPKEIRAGSDAQEVGWYKPEEVLSIYGNLRSHTLPEEVERFLRAA